jgi:phage terminase Nu1 subunit (DNA packaging protein)
MAASASPKPSKPEKGGKTSSLLHAAAVLEVHRNTLSKWIDQGCPVRQRADRARGIEWELSIKEVVDWRMKRAVEDAVSSYQDAGGNISRDEAERRKAVANAITAEIEADEALRAVVSRPDAEADMASFCQVVKTGLSNAASRIASRAASMTSAPEIQDLVQEELNRSFRAAQGELATRWAGERAPTDDSDGED